MYLSENLIVLFSENYMLMRVETTSFFIVENTTKIVFFKSNSSKPLSNASRNVVINSLGNSVYI